MKLIRSMCCFYLCVTVFYICVRVLCLNLPVHLHVFVAKKQKEETPEEVKSGSFVFSNGDRYGRM